MRVLNVFRSLRRMSTNIPKNERGPFYKHNRQSMCGRNNNGTSKEDMMDFYRVFCGFNGVFCGGLFMSTLANNDVSTISQTIVIFAGGVAIGCQSAIVTPISFPLAVMFLFRTK